MKVQHVYVDTSVFGGCFDEEFAPWSDGLMKDFRLGNFEAVTSDVVAAEVEPAPEEVQLKYAELKKYGALVVEVTSEVLELADAYEGAEFFRQITATMDCTSQQRPCTRWTC